jgi:hypothetical protein
VTVVAPLPDWWMCQCLRMLRAFGGDLRQRCAHWLRGRAGCRRGLLAVVPGQFPLRFEFVDLGRCWLRAARGHCDPEHGHSGATGQHTSPADSRPQNRLCAWHSNILPLPWQGLERRHAAMTRYRDHA